MMKLLFTGGLLVALACTASGQTPMETNHSWLKGSVKSVRVERSTISTKDGKSSEGPRVPASEYTFDGKGRLIESLIRNYEGSPHFKYHAVYNDTGKAEETYHTPKGDLIDKMVYSHGADGRLVEAIVEKSRALPKHKNVFAYDEKGRLTESVRVGTKDTGARVAYSYTDAERSIEETLYDVKGAQTFRSTLKYDGQWRLVQKELSLDTVSSDLAIFTFTYDSAGNIAEDALRINGGVNRWRYEYEADSHNNWTKRTTLSLANRNGTLRWDPVEATYRILTYGTEGNNVTGAYAADLGSIVGIMTTSSFLPGDAARREQPIFPDLAKRQLLTAKIDVYVLVDESGKVISASAKQGKDLLKDAATLAAWNWKFYPSLAGGIAARILGPVTFTFSR